MKYPFIVSLSFTLLQVLSFSAFSQDIFSREQQLNVEKLYIDSAMPDEINKLKLISLNLAHGRQASFNQILISKNKIENNLLKTANFLKEQNADVVALQEADGVSWWSGDFDHVAFLAKKANYPYRVHGFHVDRFFGKYGTAILSKYPITLSQSYRFSATPPTLSKGFVMAQLQLPCVSTLKQCEFIDIYSTHLDFARSSKRIEQIDQLKAVMHKRQNSSILLGDFNASYFGESETIEYLVGDQSLKAYFKESNQFNTYNDKRLDWVFIDPQFAFLNYQVAQPVLSDHQAVITTVLID